MQAVPRRRREVSQERVLWTGAGSQSSWVQGDVSPSWLVVTMQCGQCLVLGGWVDQGLRAGAGRWHGMWR